MHDLVENYTEMTPNMHAKKRDNLANPRRRGQFCCAAVVAFFACILDVIWVLFSTKSINNLSIHRTDEPTSQKTPKKETALDRRGDVAGGGVTLGAQGRLARLVLRHLRLQIVTREYERGDSKARAIMRT